jgi:hypothetical protein
VTRVDLDAMTAALDAVETNRPELAGGLFTELRQLTAELAGWRAFGQDMADHGHQPKPDDKRFCWVCRGMGRIVTLVGEPIAWPAGTPDPSGPTVVPSRARRHQ